MTAFTQQELWTARSSIRRRGCPGPAQTSLPMVADELAGPLESVCDRVGAADSGGRLRRVAHLLERDRSRVICDAPPTAPKWCPRSLATWPRSTARCWRRRPAATPRRRSSTFDSSRAELQRRLDDTPMCRRTSARASPRMLDGGQALLDKVTSNTIDLRDRVTAYAPILLTAEDAITGSVRVDDERIRTETQGLTRAVGARGQMMMEQLLVNQGGELPEPELRTSMITLAGTEPSTLFGMSQVLGVGSPEAQQLQAEYVQRTAHHLRPGRPAGQQPGHDASLQATDQIAAKMIDDHGARGDRRGRPTRPRPRAPTRSATRRSCVGAILLAPAAGHPGGAVAGAAAAHAARQRAAGGARRPGPRDRAGARGQGARTRRADPGAHHRGSRPGRARRRRTARAGRVPGRRAEPAAAAGRRHVRDAVAAQPLAGRPAALAHRPARAQRGGPGAAGEPVPARSPRRPDAPQRRQPVGARRARRCRASRPTPVPVAAIVNAAASEVEDYTRVVTATVPDSEIVGIGGGRPRAPARRAAGQRAALLAADLTGAGVGRAHRQRRPGHRGQRHRARHDRIRSAGRQHAPAVRRRGRPRTPRGTWVCSWSGGSPHSTGSSSGCAAPLRANRIRAPPPGCTCRPS